MTFNKYYLPAKDIADLCSTLASLCQSNDRCNHTFFLDDEQSDLPILYCSWQDDTLIGFLSTYITDIHSVEICCFVHPKHRRKGIATQLFDTMIDDYEDYYIQTSLRKNNSAGTAFVTFLEFDYSSTECKMELNRDTYLKATLDTLNLSEPCKKTSSDSSCKIALCSLVDIHEQKNENGLVFTAYLNSNSIGQCEVFSSSSTAVIHDVEIYSNYRGNQLSKPFLTLVLDKLFITHDNVILHVTKENLPAYKLYKSLDFSITDELVYYEG